MMPVEVIQGETPLILAQPHGSDAVTEQVWAALNDTGRALADTDWRIAELYADLAPGATIVQAGFHRYVIDANRPPSGESLYPGQATTDLCPLTDFDGRPIYRPEHEPDEHELAARIEAWHAPYHAALRGEINRLRASFANILVYDCHSIRSLVPRLFEGELPILNIGTDGGRTCLSKLEAMSVAHAERSGFSWVLNERFRGGWTTRHYGRPDRGVHTIQMEIAQRAYLEAEAPPWRFDPAVSAPLRAMLAALLFDLTQALAEEVSR